MQAALLVSGKCCAFPVRLQGRAVLHPSLYILSLKGQPYRPCARAHVNHHSLTGICSEGRALALLSMLCTLCVYCPSCTAPLSSSSSTLPPYFIFSVPCTGPLVLILPLSCAASPALPSLPFLCPTKGSVNSGCRPQTPTPGPKICPS